MKPTIKDVAKHAGVSFKTVSRVINREVTVGEALQKKVWASIEALSYQPNLSARGLRGAASAIGFVYDSPNSHYVTEMQQGVLDESRRQGYELVIHPCNVKAPDLLTGILAMVDRSRVGGLVLAPPLSETSEVLEALSARNIRFTLILSGDRPSDYHSPCVFVDDCGAARRITQYLIDLGHRHIAFLGGEKEHRSSVEKLAGYRQALKDYQIKPNNRLVLEGGDNFETAVKHASQLLACAPRPTAIVAGNDELAAAALFAARLEGLDVPRDLSITGFGDSPFSQQTWPNLTTARQANDEIAQAATRLLAARLRDRAGNELPESGVYCPQLVVRDSTCPPA